METIQFRAMNTNIFLAAEGSSHKLAEGFARARQYINESEQRFSRFIPESELSQLNHSAGSWFHASPDLLTLVLLAQHYSAQTAGLFDPTVLIDLERIGYNRSMEYILSQGVFSPPTAPTRRQIPFDSIIIRPEESLICLPHGMSLDLGGIAKGWIAEEAARILADYSTACGVNAGGDMFLIGPPAGSDGWTVAIEDPMNPENTLATLLVPSGAVATSSSVKRSWQQGTLRRHHIIDPRTGEPAESEWLSVTVMAEHADQCEAYAKALLIAGPQQAAGLALKAGIAFLAVDRQGVLVGNQESKEYLYDRKTISTNA